MLPVFVEVLHGSFIRQWASAVDRLLAVSLGVALLESEAPWRVGVPTASRFPTGSIDNCV